MNNKFTCSNCNIVFHKNIENYKEKINTGEYLCNSCSLIEKDNQSAWL